METCFLVHNNSVLVYCRKIGTFHTFFPLIGISWWYRQNRAFLFDWNNVIKESLPLYWYSPGISVRFLSYSFVVTHVVGEPIMRTRISHYKWAIFRRLYKYRNPRARFLVLLVYCLKVVESCRLDRRSRILLMETLFILRRRRLRERDFHNTK